MKVVLIIPGQPSSNPRTVKEAVTLFENGYKVTVVYNYWSEWAQEQDIELFNKYPEIQFLEAGGNPTKSKFRFFYTRLRHKLYKLVYRCIPNSLFIATRRESRAFNETFACVKSINADLYVAHHVAVLPIAAAVASKYGAKYGYDAEDFYRGMDQLDDLQFRRRVLIENKFISLASYVTAASPLIAEEYKKLYNRDIDTIQNAFGLQYQQANTKFEAHQPIKLFWFSQTIGKGRGIEDIIKAMAMFTVNTFTLTLLGSSDETNKNYFKSLLAHHGGRVDNLQFIDPVSLEKICQIASDHDIGLALENPEETNRKICLTNKIFIYLLAGNAVIFSNTPAQQLFFDQNPGVGKIYNFGDIEELKCMLDEYKSNMTMLKKHKEHNYALAESAYNWENESVKYIAVVRKTFQLA